MFIARLLPGILVLASAWPAAAEEPSDHIECRAQFARTASHADLVQAYGVGNVSFETVNRAEGETAQATILFAGTPQRRLEIEWYDTENRRLPSTITVFGETNQWTGPLGIRNGMAIRDIEQRAGKPFTINGFGFDVAGAEHFSGTRLESLPGGCRFGANFEIEGGLPPENLKRFIGEVEIGSDDPDLLSLRPTLWLYTLSYPPPGAD